MNTISSILNFIGLNIGVLEITQATVSSLPITINDSRILATHKVIGYVLTRPVARTGNWTATTADGSVTISGSIDGTTGVTLFLSLKAN